MRKLKYILMLGALGLLALSSCKKETENISLISYYPDLKGDNPYWAAVGSYVDPGVEANGVDVTSDCTVTGIKPSEPGVYDVQYEYIDPNGIKLKQTRRVYLYDASGRIKSGEYTSSYKGLGIVVVALSSDLFYIESIEGGYAWSAQSNPQAFKEAYGSRLAMQGRVRLNADNTLALDWTDPNAMSAYGAVPYASSVSIDGSFYDPTTGKLNFKTVMVRKSNGAVLTRNFTLTLE